LSIATVFSVKFGTVLAKIYDVNKVEAKEPRPANETCFRNFLLETPF
tara:strand:+ start:178 stop:318 length:141 start_codon:yes stop_codon:yes gene_type:complete